MKASAEKKLRMDFCEQKIEKKKPFPKGWKRSYRVMELFRAEDARGRYSNSGILLLQFNPPATEHVFNHIRSDAKP